MITYTTTNNKHIKLYSNCIPVKGKSRSVVCDLQRRRFEFIPNELYDFLQEYNGAAIDEIRNDYDEDSQVIINEYLNFLQEKNYLLVCDEEEVEWFPKFEMTWHSSSLIENAIIDVDAESEHDYKNIIDQLGDLGCCAVVYRFFARVEQQELDYLLSLTARSCIEAIQIIMPYQLEVDIVDFEKIVDKYPRVNSLLFHSVPEEKEGELEELNEHTDKKIGFTLQKINSSTHCGFISPAYFRVNLKTFTESQSFNNCLNKKISVDVDGNIKNCPALPDSYGNIKTVSFEEALQIEGFKKMWTINKDQIEVCKTCEFRYICSDCRAFTEDNNTPFSKPIKCSYNPETMSWA